MEASNDQISSYASIFSPSHRDLIRCEVCRTRSISKERPTVDFSGRKLFFDALNQKMMDKVVCTPWWALDLIKKFGFSGKRDRAKIRALYHQVLRPNIMRLSASSYTVSEDFQSHLVQSQWTDQTKDGWPLSHTVAKLIKTWLGPSSSKIYRTVYFKEQLKHIWNHLKSYLEGKLPIAVLFVHRSSRSKEARRKVAPWVPHQMKYCG